MQLHVGQAEDDDAAAAAETAAAEAMVDDAALMYVFASSRYDLEAVMDGVSGVAGDVPVVGCSSTIEVTGDGHARGTVAVGVVAGDVDVGVGLGTGLEDDSAAAGKDAIRAAFDGLDAERVPPFQHDREREWAPDRDTFITVFADPLHGVGAEVLDGINAFLGPGFSLTGEFAADDMAFEETHVFHGNAVYQDAVTCAVVRSDATVGSARRHGFRPTPNTFTVTASQGSFVQEVDGRAPAAVYAEVFGEDKATDPGFLLMAPFGIPQEGEDEYLLRVTLDVNDQGCYHCGARVPEDAEVTLMMGEKDNLLDAAGAAAEEAVQDAGLERGAVDGALVFSCVGRDAIYDDPALTDEELERVTDALGDDAAIVGLYGFGQIATTRGWAAFNEETMAIQVFGSDR